jgi:hypothetical protein
VVAVACVAVGCQGSTPSGERDSRLVVAKPHYDFGLVTQGSTLRHVFAVHNRSSATHRLQPSLDVLGCSATAVPSVLFAGEKGKIEVTCRAEVPGLLRVSLPVHANVELRVSAQVAPLLAFDRDVVALSMPFGEERSAEVRLDGKRAKEARLRALEAPPPVLEVSVLPGEGGKSEGVLIRARGDAVGTHAGSLRYATGLEKPREVSLPYSVKVTGTLTVTPTNPVLDLGALGPRQAVVKVTSTQTGFVVTRAEVLEGPFAASVRRAGDGYEIEVTVIETKLSATARGVNGRLRIHSNDRTERAKEIPLFMLGGK